MKEKVKNDIIYGISLAKAGLQSYNICRKRYIYRMETLQHGNGAVESLVKRIGGYAYNKRTHQRAPSVKIRTALATSVHTGKTKDYSVKQRYAITNHPPP